MLVKTARAMLPYLPEAAAFALTRFLAGLPVRPPLKDEDRHTLQASRRIEFGSGRRRLAWTWGEGPLVIFVHGWGGRAGQMVKLAREVAARGFKVVVFDAGAHGESPGCRIGFDNFIEDLGDLAATLARPVHAYIGHSAGGLCLMAARLIRGIHASRYVCIAAPRAPYIPIHEIRVRLDPSPAVLRRCEALFAGQFGMGWDELDRANAFRGGEGEDLLLVYDVDDPRVGHRDAERIRSVWPEAQIVKTSGLGHQKLLWDARVIARVGDFVAARVPRRDDTPAHAAVFAQSGLQAGF